MIPFDNIGLYCDIFFLLFFPLFFMNNNLSNSFVYCKIIPWLLISLCLLYVHILFYRFFMWQYQRYKRKRDRVLRQRWETEWRQRMMQLEKTTILQPPEQTYQAFGDSSITLVDNNPLKHYNTKQETGTRLTLPSKTQQKRRQLLWQWGVAMGYCKYHHGYYMDKVVHRLLNDNNKK